MNGNRLEIRVDGLDISADKMLTVASRALKLLRAVEREMLKGGKSTTRWRVDMMSGYRYGLIFLRGEPDRGGEMESMDASAVIERVREAIKAEDHAVPVTGA